MLLFHGRQLDISFAPNCRRTARLRTFRRTPEPRRDLIEPIFAVPTVGMHANFEEGDRAYGFPDRRLPPLNCPFIFLPRIRIYDA